MHQLRCVTEEHNGIVPSSNIALARPYLTAMAPGKSVATSRPMKESIFPVVTLNASCCMPRYCIYSKQHSLLKF